MKTIHSYQSIIFDLGGVILNLDYYRTVAEFKKHTRDLDESVFLGKEMQLPFFSDYEVGRIQTEEFRDRFRTHYQLSISDSEFDRCWSAMILDFPALRIQLLQTLRSRGKKVFLLSNINELHASAVEESFAKLGMSLNFFDLFDKVYYSHLVGLRKPHQEIFEHVLSDQRMSKDQTLFIDDSLHHVLSSRNFGLDAIHLVKPQTIEELLF